MLRRVVVVGASLGGLRAAEALRRRGYGGELLLVGEEAHAPYDRPPLSKQLLRGEWPAERVRLRAEQDLAALQLELRLGTRVERLDAARKRLLLQGGGEIGYDGLVIATGASPRSLPGVPPLAGVHVLRTLDDALAIRRVLTQGSPRVCVAGAGFIGLEVAASCRALGLEVSAVEPLALPLQTRVGAAMAALVAALHRDHGVALHCGAGVSALEGGARVERVRLSDGSVLPADLVVVGVGVRPAIEWLQGSGIALGDGVLCDASCATSLPDVVAAGDVARWHDARLGESLRIEHWSQAGEMAEHAAARLLAGPEGAAAFTPVPYFWSDQYDVKIQVAGWLRPGDTMELVEGSVEARKLVALFGRAGRLRAVLALNRPAQLVRYRRLLAGDTGFEAAIAQARAQG